MNESDVKRGMVKSIQAAGGYARRFEDQYAVGMVDCIFVPIGLPAFFAEVKMISINIFGPTPRQLIELCRIQDVMGATPHVIPIVIGWHDRVYYFSPPALKIDRNQCFSEGGDFNYALTQYYEFRRQNESAH